MNGRQIIKTKRKELENLKAQFAENEKKLIDLQKEYDNNLDENLMPINKDKLEKTAKLIQQTGSIQNKIKITIRNLEKEISDIKIAIDNNKNSSSKVNEDDEPTLELPIKVNEDDEPTLELPIKEIREKMKMNKIESNMKIEFDGSIGAYRIYSPFSSVPELHVFSTELLDNNSQYIKDLKKKYGNNILDSGLDFNIVKALEEFDKKYNTNFQEKYINNSFKGKIIYDFRKIKKINKEFINPKQRKQFTKLANRYKKKHENCKVITYFNRNTAILLGVGVATVAGGLAVNTKLNSNNNEQNTAIESTIENDLEKTDKLPEITEEDLEKTDKLPEITQEDLEKTDKLPNIKDSNEKYYDFDGNEISKEEYEKLWQSIENNPVDVDAEEGYEPIKVGSLVQLENVDIYYRASDQEPVGNTERLNCDSYRIDAMSATNGSEYLGKTIRDDSIDVDVFIEQTEKNDGPLYTISLHIQGLDENGNIIYEDVGWIRYNALDIENKNVKTK